MEYTPLVAAVLAQTMPNNLGLEYPGNWPHSAQFALEYAVIGPGLDYVPKIAFFDNGKDLLTFFHEYRTWLKASLSDFNLEFSVWEWNASCGIEEWHTACGPEHKYTRTITG